ncbi:hypothetical protein AB0J84_24345 [Micromonospora arborensis]|uniref:hypothetical protein n=1 Tax=Micromonospora arborensis TaxID=2116518 RepID=UPI00342018DF
MNDQRLRLDLTDLAEEVTVVDLRDRTLRTSRRLGVQRAVATSAAALVLIAAVTGTAFAIRPNQSPPPLPADTPSVTATPTPAPTRSPSPTPSTSADAPGAPPSSGSTQWPQLTWYTEQEFGQKQNDPPRIWRRTSGGTWQVARTGRPSSGTTDGAIVVSPNGERMAWSEASAGRLVISAFDGTQKHVVATQSGWTCMPSWLDSGRVLFSVGRERDWTLVAINADGTGRKVLANHQADCPTVDNGWWAQVAKRTVSIGNERGTRHTISPRIPADRVVDRVAGISADGRTAVLSTHVPNPGECACTWEFRTYRVDVASGAVTELAPLEAAWRKPTGHGGTVDVIFAADGTLVAQVNAATPADDAPAYRLVRYAADGRVLASTAVPAGQPRGDLLG